MRALLVNPPSRRALPSILPPGVEQGRGRFPPLGVLYLAASIRSLPGVEVSVVDAHAEDLTADEIALWVREGEIDLVGISTLTFNLLDAQDVAMAVKAARPETTVVAGGPHPHLYPDETLSLGPFDVVVRGEGEESFSELIKGWPETKESPPPGVWVKGGARGDPEVAPFIEDLDALPFPARDLSRVEIYHSVLSGLGPITTLMSSRGCRHRCTFCDRPHLGKRFRPRSAKNVVDEIEECAGMGIKEVVFYDDTATSDRERVAEICGLMLERKLDVPWDVRARVSDLKADDYKLAKRAGLARIHFGVESGDPEILKSLKKGVTIDQAREAFRLAREAGVETLAYFMVGLPGETGSSLDKTLALARELDPDYVHFSALIPFPGTPIYHEALERGVIERDVWAEFAKSPTPDFTPPVWEEELSADEITRALAAMYRKFYRRPRVILRRLAKVKSLSGLVRGARMGARILFMGGDKA